MSELEQWLWDAACEIRGPLDAPKFKDYILPLVFLKRLSDVFDDEISALGEEFEDEEAAQDRRTARSDLAELFIRRPPLPSGSTPRTLRSPASGYPHSPTSGVGTHPRCP